MKFTEDELRLSLKAVHQLVEKASEAALDAERSGLFLYAEQIIEERLALEKLARRFYAELRN